MDVCKFLEPDEQMNAIFPGESFLQPFAMRVGAARQIAGYADIEGAWR